jgi:hypothetical protein
MRLPHCRLIKRILPLLKLYFYFPCVVLPAWFDVPWTPRCDAAFFSVQVASDARMNSVTLVIGVSWRRVLRADASLGGFDSALLYVILLLRDVMS